MGFLSCLGFGRPTNHARPVSRETSGDTPVQSAPATANSWTAYKDAHGRRCWRNNLTGQWTFNNPRGAGTAHVRFPPAQPPQQFWPVSPFPGTFHHPAPWSTVVPVSPVLVFPPMAPQPPPPLTEEGEDDDDKNKDDDKKKKKGRWVEVFSEQDGEKHWKHTGTNKIRHTDPFV